MECTTINRTSEPIYDPGKKLGHIAAMFCIDYTHFLTFLIFLLIIVCLMLCLAYRVGQVAMAFRVGRLVADEELGSKEKIVILS